MQLKLVAWNIKLQSLNTLESFCLTADELCIVEVVDAHCLAYLCHSLGGCLAGFLGALAQDVVDLGNVLLQFVATLTHRFEHVIEDGVEELLAGAVAYTSVNVVLLEFDMRGAPLDIFFTFFHTSFSESLR